jgi:hypothetical protein
LKTTQEKYLRVLDLMKSKGGRLTVDDADLKVLLGTAPKTGKELIYRVATYMSYIRRFAKLEVKTIRTGKRAVAYELIVVNPDATDDATKYQASEYINDPEPESTAAVTVAT